MWWFLTREVLRLRGTINRKAPWDVMVDLYFYRDPEEVSKRIFILMDILFSSQTEKEDQTGVTGQDRDAQNALESQYYDEGPSMMPASENFAGNRDNWGASADNWATGTAATAGESNEWSAPAAPNTTGGSAW